jgi:galactitol-specific phosphotransferase system IIB component
MKICLLCLGEIQAPSFISLKKLEELCDAKNIGVKDLEEEMQQVAKESDPFTFETME